MLDSVPEHGQSFKGGVLEFSEPNSPRDSHRSSLGRSRKQTIQIPGFKELDFPQESIDIVLKKVLKARGDPDIIPIDDGVLNSFVNGLVNTNSACFMNVVFQALVRIPGIKDYFLHNDYQAHLEYFTQKQQGSLAERFGDFVKTYYNFNEKVLEAEELKHFIGQRQPRFNQLTQEDAHEFFLFLIDEMGRELNRADGDRPIEEVFEASYDEGNDNKKPSVQIKNSNCPKSINYISNSFNLASPSMVTKKVIVKEAVSISQPKASLEELGCRKWKEDIDHQTSVFTDTLMGQLLSTIQCRTCSFKSQTFESFCMLELPVPKKTKVTLKQCFQEYCKQETLDAEEWNCPKCNKKRQADKSLKLWRIPPVLVLYFKRFKEEDGMTKKNECLVTVNLAGENLEYALAEGAAAGLPRDQGLEYQPFGFIVDSPHAAPHRVADERPLHLLGQELPQRGLDAGRRRALPPDPRGESARGRVA